MSADYDLSPQLARAQTTPTFSDVLRARLRIRPYLRPTPLYRYPALDQTVSAEVWVKHENHQPIGAFKVRGGINLASRLRTCVKTPQGCVAESPPKAHQDVSPLENPSMTSETRPGRPPRPTFRHTPSTRMSAVAG
ncbi:MAG: pyridoxal-phosphate dependent enzyme [Egibacteraceae bacterium]